MIRKHQIIKKIGERKVIFILRHDDLKEAELIVEYAIEGGMKTIELTMTTPGVLRLVETLVEKYKSDSEILIGVGTVLDDMTARQAILAGAHFIVSPHFESSIIKVCNRYGVPVIPGTTNTSEIVQALEYGVDVVKFFPARSYGPSVIKDMRGPLPQVNFIPTAGIDISNVQDWINGGAFAVGVGRDLYSKAIETGDYHLIKKSAEQYIDRIRDCKAQIAR